jgi:DNA-binding transcriptional LysR family regulator
MTARRAWDNVWRSATPHNGGAVDVLSRSWDNKTMPKPRERLAAQDLVVFAAVANAGGVRRGAEVLDLPRSTVSRHLKSLERALDGRLITRSTRRFVLTELGVALLEHCARLQSVLDAVAQVAAHAASEPTGTLRLTTSQIIGEELLPGTIAEYVARFPNVRVEVRIANELVDLRRAGFDLAVRTGPLHDASDLFATRLGASLKGYYASPAYVKLRGAPDSPGALAHHSCIVVSAKPYARWNFRGRQGESYADVTGRLAVDSYALARRACIDGVGIMNVPNLYAAQHVRDGTLVPVLERFWQRTELYAVHASGHPAPPKIRAFIDLTRKSLAGRLER